MKQTFEELKGRLREVRDIGSACAVLSWDQTTYMPIRGAAARGRQMALLRRIAHEKHVDPAIGALIEKLEKETGDLPFDSIEASLARVARRDYDRATRIPVEFSAEAAEHSTASYQAWVKARPENDFAAVRPYLEKTLELSRRMAGFFPGHDHIADPLIDFADYGMKASSVRKVFGELREQLVPMVQAITSQPIADDACLHARYPTADQIAFGRELVTAIGFDFDRGRQDFSPHPFMTKFSTGDVRITTRVDELDLAGALFSTLHECGHAMYELGIDPELEGTPLATGTSAGVHESQSRLWENLVGRSRGFWERYYPTLRGVFPTQLGSVSLDHFYRAINKVERTLIRTEADEITYDLHVILRFDLELDLLEGKLSVADLPEAWRARYASDLGVAPPDDRDGVMQDVHWFIGLIGGRFQGYTLGNMLAALFYEKAVEAVPSIPDQIRAGRFGPLRDWLGTNVYQHGAKLTAPELIERVTGGPMRVEPYVRHLRSKFGDLYDLS